MLLNYKGGFVVLSILRKTLSTAFAVLLVLTAVSTAASAADSSARIYLLTSPIYGDEQGVFSGVVRGRDGSRITDPAGYAIYAALSLDGTKFWPKPFFDRQFSSVYQDGSFAIRTVTAPTDKDAVYFDFYLVTKTWAKNHPDPKKDDVAAAAADHISVQRMTGGRNLFTPGRNTSNLSKPVFYMPQIRSDKILADVDLHYDTAALETLPQEKIDEYLNRVSRFAYGVRFFSAGSEENRIAIRLAKEKYGLFVAVNAWISASDTSSQQECDALCSLCNAHLVDMAFVGSEALYRHDVSEEKLIGYIDYVRARIRDKKISVSTTDTIDNFYDSPALCGACDVLAVNHYAYWQGVESEKCAQRMIDSVDGLAKMYPLKSVVVSEAGYPTQGITIGKAVPSEQNAAAFFTSVFRYSVTAKLPVFFFMAADCPYKGTLTAEGHFGILDNSLVYKNCFARIEPFRSCPLPAVTVPKPTKESTGSVKTIQVPAVPAGENLTHTAKLTGSTQTARPQASSTALAKSETKVKTKTQTQAETTVDAYIERDETTVDAYIEQDKTTADAHTERIETAETQPEQSVNKTAVRIGVSVLAVGFIAVGVCIIRKKAHK